jgi:hypothetical protein
LPNNSARFSLDDSARLLWIANRILDVLISILAFVVIPIQIVTTLVLGLAVSLTFGLLLLPISLLWMLLYFPMLGLSWVCNRVSGLRELIGILFIPWVLVADVFVALMPSMGELESRASKLMLCGCWPYTWEFSRFLAHKLELESSNPDAIALCEVLDRTAQRDPLMQRVILRVQAQESLDPGV